MDKIRIKIYYSTGNSFGTDDTSNYLELDWENKDIAKENLQRIKEHYQMYLDIEDQKQDSDDVMDRNKLKDWYVNEGNDDYYAQHCLYLKADNGNKMQMTAFWTGYFERLYEAELVFNSNDTKISF